MNNKLKGIDTKNCSYYFFDDMVNVKDFDPNIISTTKIFLFITLDTWQSNNLAT